MRENDFDTLNDDNLVDDAPVARARSRRLVALAPAGAFLGLVDVRRYTFSVTGFRNFRIAPGPASRGAFFARLVIA